MTLFRKISLCGMAGAAAMIAGAAQATTTTFSNGAEGWDGGRFSGIVAGGRDGPGFQTQNPAFNDIAGFRWANETNSGFVGDFTRSRSVTIGLDVLTNSISVGIREVPRDLFVQLTDFGNAADPSDDAAVLYSLGTLSASISGWQTMSVTIADTGVAALPDGWYGTDNAGSLTLPAGRTFADILASVDRIEFTSIRPDLGYALGHFDVVGDNFTVTPGAVTAVPEASSWAMMVAGFGCVAMLMRRRRPQPARA